MDEDNDGKDEDIGDNDEDLQDEQDSSPRIEVDRAKTYKKTMRQLQTFYDEISLISAKKPDNPINQFKLSLINETLDKANFVLGDDRPFPGFTSFDNASMPSASDVVLILSHYMGGLQALREKYSVDGRWRVTGGEDFDEDYDDI